MHDRNELKSIVKKSCAAIVGHFICCQRTALGIPLSSVHGLQTKDNILKTHTASLKPKLTDENKVKRYLYALDMIHPKTHAHAMRKTLHFRDMFNVIHVDKKWFYLIKEGAHYILVHDEKPPELSCYNKNSISEVMFLCALARPKTLSNGTYFDGKIGIWPIGHMVPAGKQVSGGRKEH